MGVDDARVPELRNKLNEMANASTDGTTDGLMKQLLKMDNARWLNPAFFKLAGIHCNGRLSGSLAATLNGWPGVKANDLILSSRPVPLSQEMKHAVVHGKHKVAIGIKLPAQAIVMGFLTRDADSIKNYGRFMCGAPGKPDGSSSRAGVPR